jgi:hypothetical protein
MQPGDDRPAVRTDGGGGVVEGTRGVMDVGVVTRKSETFDGWFVTRPSFLWNIRC